MSQSIDFTNGKIIPALLRFVWPVFLALFLQATYGAVDLLIVGQFAATADVSAVATGSMIMHTFTMLVSSIAMGMTILLGEKVGMGMSKEGGRIVGSGILLFTVIALIMTAITVILSPQLASLMQAPKEAFSLTSSYIRICGFGSLVIIAYNLIGSVFRGLGDSRTPLITVLIACVCNIGGDLLLVAVFHMGTNGAAIATVAAQLISVLISLWLMKRKTLPFELTKESIRWDRGIIRKVLSLGTPIALQDLLVSISFLVVLAIVNSIGVTESAGVGVAEKVCAFIMLIPLAFMQSMSAFVAQNRGAGKLKRAEKGLWSSIAVSAVVAVIMFFVTFFAGDLLSGIFSKDAATILASAEYLKAYAIDCLLTCFMFCFIGFFNGMEYTKFVMIQGIAGAFLVRIPIAYLMSRQIPVSLFHVGLATPCSSLLQIILCFLCFVYWKKKQKKKTDTE